MGSVPSQLSGIGSIQFSLRNASAQPLTFEQTFVGARDPRGANNDFAHANAGAVLSPNGRLQISGSIVVDTRGLWQFFRVTPCALAATKGFVPMNGAPLRSPF